MTDKAEIDRVEIRPHMRAGLILVGIGGLNALTQASSLLLRAVQADTPAALWADKLVFMAMIAWGIWISRKKIVFEDGTVRFFGLARGNRAGRNPGCGHRKRGLRDFQTGRGDKGQGCGPGGPVAARFQGGGGAVPGAGGQGRDDHFRELKSDESTSTLSLRVARSIHTILREPSTPDSNSIPSRPPSILGRGRRSSRGAADAVTLARASWNRDGRR